jgi:DNA-binding IclR family transcriptional regulator
MAEYIGAPYQPHSETSKAAAKAVTPNAKTQRETVLAAIRQAGTRGLTAGELEDALHLSGSSIRPRLVELRRQGLVKESGFTRPTSSRREATVYITAKEK